MICTRKLSKMPTTEEDFLAQVLDLAKLYKWRRAHFRPARTQAGWRTPVQGDGIGFPDLVLVKPPRLIIAELKSDTGKVSPDQELWLKAFAALPYVETWVWRPRDWDDIVDTLGRGTP